ncbi:MAG: hypothetical protein R3Y58_00605 [Eubacteriales bacterium]
MKKLNGGHLRSIGIVLNVSAIVGIFLPLVRIDGKSYSITNLIYAFYTEEEGMNLLGVEVPPWIALVLVAIFVILMIFNLLRVIDNRGNKYQYVGDSARFVSMYVLIGIFTSVALTVYKLETELEFTPVIFVVGGILIAEFIVSVVLVSRLEMKGGAK